MFSKLLIAGLLFGSATFAQVNTIPVNSHTIDDFSMITAKINELGAVGAPVLVTLGMNIVNAFVGTMFTLLLIRVGFQYFRQHHVVLDPGPIMAFLVTVAAINTMLYYYDTPIPGVGFGFGRLPAEITRQISGFIDISSYNLLLAKVHEVQVKMQQPEGYFPYLDLLTYCFVYLNMLILQAIFFVVSLYGFFFYGLTVLVGPLFIPALLFPAFRHYFYGWLTTLIKFAFYRVAAAGYIFIFAGAWMLFLQDLNDFSLAMMLKMLPVMVSINFLSIVLAAKMPAWVDGNFHGSASAGHLPGFAHL